MDQRDARELTAAYDVFVSYARLDRAPVMRLVEALRARGLRVWFDEADIATFESISQGIADGLARSKLLLAYYSATYPTRRACQWELTAAFIAAYSAGDPRQRVVVINPEPDPRHIHPIELRDARFHPFHADGLDGDLAAIADAVGARCAELGSPLGQLRRVTHVSWHGGQPRGSNRFVGRTPTLWRIHSALFGSDVPTITAEVAGLVQICGLGGIGKSLLAEEYALRFGAAYPGGVFLLNATGSRDRQIAELAARLGLATDGLSNSQIEGALDRALRSADEPYLWLVDDMSPDLAETERRKWLSPNTLGKSLVTTRGRQHDATGVIIDLAALDDAEGYDLLTMRVKPIDAGEELAAREIVAALGGHALALDVAGAALFKLQGREGFRCFLDKISAPGPDVLELAAQLRFELPNGHDKSIAATLFRSIDLLDEGERDFLRLAAVLAEEIIPFDLVDAVFRILGKSAFWGMAHVADGVVSHSLAEVRASADHPRGYVVHALVSRVVRLHDPSTARIEQVRDAAVTLFNTRGREVLPTQPTATRRILEAHAFRLALTDTPDGRELRSWLVGHVYELTRGWMEHRVDVAHSLREKGDFAGAKEQDEPAFTALNGLFGQEHPSALLARESLALSLCGLGDFDTARDHQELVLAVRVRVLGSDHPHTLLARTNLERTLSAQIEALQFTLEGLLEEPPMADSKIREPE